MAIETTNNMIKVDSIIKIQSSQVVVKATLDTSSDNCIILGTSADAKAVAIEPMQGEVLINGKVNFKTILLTNDSDVISLDYYADFTDNIKNEMITASSRLMMRLSVVDTDSTLSGTDIVLTAVVEIMLEEINSQEYKAIDIEDDTVFTKQDNIVTQQLKSISETAFEIYEEIETSSEIDKILVYDAEVVISSVKCGIDMIQVVGEAYATISYKVGDGIESRNVLIPFSEELDASGVDVECSALPELMVKNKRIVLSGAQDENIIRAEMVIGVKALVFTKAEHKVISDMYSSQYNIEIQEALIPSVDFLQECAFKEKISAIASLDKGMPPIKSIIACCLAKNNIANLIPEDDAIVIEGLMTTCVLYLDDNNKPTSVRAELPYSLRLAVDGVRKTDKLSGYGAVYNVVAKALNNNEIEVKADIRLCVRICREKLNRVIMSITEGEMIDIKKNAISFYIASGGEEMWDIVKNLEASPDTIIQQNPSIELPLAPGDRVKIYRAI